MDRRPDYADTLRDMFLTATLVPIGGLHTAVYWAKESLERTSRLTDGVITTIALARTARAARVPAAAGSPAADVLSQDLLDFARTYVSSMISLPRDAALYFTGFVERRIESLRQQLLPDATADLETFVDNELANQLAELDRLSVAARAEAGRAARRPGSRMSAGARYGRLVERIDGLRQETERVREGITTRRPRPALPPGRSTADLELERVRFRVWTTLREAARLLDGRPPAAELEKVRGQLEAAFLDAASGPRRRAAGKSAQTPARRRTQTAGASAEGSRVNGEKGTIKQRKWRSSGAGQGPRE